ncbi:MAG: hypothetical protein NV67_03380 [Gammaproteobacteria bacterium (ex Lamellibrachia satsuma)]|nr:MAG: radical SAM/SPASM domain-containing protein [Gammaproteobacteria bacterium (ex Lamellibrachia satsuma)]RRS35458.1 MAG: hypothetical protein NV67_10280 [Gammaproteobacteria bacterium (ex Lamellibrachia satsuma)]RRS37058.1 MAG: hypothetical protein NV67_03380 [Gammaproteobacteria bacterium (ex Lamellibrachia satsuma)]
MNKRPWHIRAKSQLAHLVRRVGGVQIRDAFANVVKHGRTPFDFVEQDHFTPLGDPDNAMRLFKRSVDMVEIEVFSYCNRICWFCPNAKYDRRSAQHHMDDNVYLSILRQLGKCDYNRKISYSRYNEPLADRIIIDKIAQARSLVPKAVLHLNTNGDYLTKEYLDKLYDAGLNSLNIQIYLRNNQTYDHEETRQLMQKKVAELGLKAKITVDLFGRRLEAGIGYKDMLLRIYGRNFDNTGCNRGETVGVTNQPVRTSPCLSPFYHVYIDYNGSVMPCCNLRSDIPEHQDCIIGNLNTQSNIFLVYASANAVAWRRSLVGFEKKDGLCKHCSFVPFAKTSVTTTVQDKLMAMSKKR